MSAADTFNKTAGDDWTWTWRISDKLEAKYPGSRLYMSGWDNPRVEIRESAVNESEDVDTDILFTSAVVSPPLPQILFTGHDFGDSQLEATSWSMPIPVWTWYIPKSITANTGSYEKRFIVAQVEIQGKATTIIQRPFFISPERISL